MADKFNVEPYQTPIDAGGEIVLIAPGLSGEGTYYGRRPRATMRADTLESTTFSAALDESQLEDVHTLILPPGAPISVSESERTRDVGKVAADEISLQVPGEGAESQYVVYQDEDGVLSIELPEPAGTAANAQVRSGASGGVFCYKLRIRSAGAKTKTRGMLGVLGQKVIKVIARRLGVALGTKLAADLWEATARSFEGFHGHTKSSGADPLAEVLAEKPQLFTNWKDLDGKKSLLFIHGTTSNTTGAFGGLKSFPESATKLFGRYDGGVLGFNHHTLGRSVCENTTRLYAEIAAHPGTYTFDIVCHSRGGLLARTLKELNDATIGALTNKANWTRLAESVVQIDRIVFVATPNVGTDLAASNNLPKWLNRMANVASFLPDSAGSVPLSAVLAVASDVAASAVKLPGLADMDPGGTFLKKLNATPIDARSYWAVEAKYQAQGALLRALEDPIIDGLFQGKDNDLVVPTEGVSVVRPAFILEGTQVKKFSEGEAVSHTQFFTKEETWDHILSAVR
jgi:hypothetical protein